MADSKPAAASDPVEDHRKAIAEEWGTWVAVAPISFNGVPAYNVGAPVPASNVTKYGYDADGLVAKVGTKAAAAGQAVTPPPDTSTVSLAVPESK